MDALRGGIYFFFPAVWDTGQCLPAATDDGTKLRFKAGFFF